MPTTYELQQSEIDKLSGGRGYAFLTEGQKASVNALKAPSMISSQQGEDILRRKEEIASSISPVPQVSTTTTEKPTAPSTSGANIATPPKTTSTETTITLINPETGQEVTFGNPEVNRQNIESYLSSGYALESASGSVPSWLTATKTGDVGVIPKTKEEAHLETAKKDYEDAKTKLETLDIANDPVMQGILADITSSWDNRIRDMEKTNVSRQASLKQRGIRTGSRYVEEAFGGIMTAEEREGVARVAELETKKRQALAEAREAYRTQKWNEYAKFVDLAEKEYIRQHDAVTKLNEIALAESKKLETKRQEEQELLDKESRIADLIDSGVTSREGIIGALGGAVSSEIIDNYLDRLQEETGATTADYNTWKVESAAGNTDKPFLEWIQAQKATTRAPKIVTLTQEDEFGNKSQNPFLFDQETGQLVPLGASGGSTGGVSPGVSQEASPALVNAFKKVLGSTTAAERKSFGNTVNQLIESGDTQRALESIIDKAVETGDAEMYKQYLTQIQVVNSLNKLDQKLNEFEEAGGDTGILRGTVEDIAQKLGATSDPNLLRIGAEISQVLFDYRRSLSGVAFPPEETKQYKKILPSASKNLDVNRELIQSFRENNVAKIENTLRARLGPTNYDALRDDIVGTIVPSMKKESGGGGETRTLNGKTYRKVEGGWEEI